MEEIKKTTTNVNIPEKPSSTNGKLINPEMPIKEMNQSSTTIDLGFKETVIGQGELENPATGDQGPPKPLEPEKKRKRLPRKQKSQINVAVTAEEMKLTQKDQGQPIDETTTSKDIRDSKRAFDNNKETLNKAFERATALANAVDEKLRLKTFYMEAPQKPIFSSCELQHPLNFLENLMRYFKKIPVAQQTINTIVECLQQPALDWAMVHKDRWSNVQDFKKDFLDEYWGKYSQNSLRREIFNHIHIAKDMARHFILLVSQARWLPNKIPDEELISEIMNHFPGQVQIAWHLSNKRTVLETAEFLRKMDEIVILNESEQERAERESQKCKYKLRGCDVDEISKRVKVEHVNRFQADYNN